jgi:hypothetical protein
MYIHNPAWGEDGHGTDQKEDFVVSTVGILADIETRNIK